MQEVITRQKATRTRSCLDVMLFYVVKLFIRTTCKEGTKTKLAEVYVELQPVNFLSQFYFVTILYNDCQTYKNKNAPCIIMYGISTNLLNELYFNAIIIEVTVKIMNNRFQIDNNIQGIKD